MTETYQHALVLGLGASGEAAARLLRGEGAAVTGVDRQLPACAGSLRSLGVRLEVAGDTLPEGAFDVCVVSPGVPVGSPWVQAAARRGIPVRAELEVGWSRFGGRTVAVTGTNGKSSVVKWMAEALRRDGLRAEPCGNYGRAVCDVVARDPGVEWLVVEVSSFQLETTLAFRPDLAVLLNLMPNHLDRHGDFATYERTKARLFENSRPGDVCVAPALLVDRLRDLSGGEGDWHTFGTTAAAEYVYRHGAVYRDGACLADFGGTYFGNEVLGANAAAMVAAWHAAGRSVSAVEAAARAFQPLPHRMETVATRNGIRFVNDSKATTLAALAAGLRMCGPGTRLIAGGLLKETDLGWVKEMLAERVGGVYLIGRASEQMASAWSDACRCVPCGTLEAAVAAAWRDARPGEAVLLSPGCASFDQFANFEERGERFREVVRRLTGE